MKKENRSITMRENVAMWLEDVKNISHYTNEILERRIYIIRSAMAQINFYDIDAKDLRFLARALHGAWQITWTKDTMAMLSKLVSNSVLIGEKFNVLKKRRSELAVMIGEDIGLTHALIEIASEYWSGNTWLEKQLDRDQ